MSSYGQYTKHYFANDRRVSSRVGGGLPQGADAPHTTQLPTGRSWYDRAVAMKEQMERAFECADMTEDRLEFATAWGIEKLVGNSSDGEAFFYHQNHQGSPVFVSTASGYLTEQQLLQAYGEVFASAQNAASWRSPYSFTGKEFDAESGLHYFGARYYLSSVGVWLSTDPLADKYPNVTPYSYCLSNPVNFRDPFGLEPWPIWQRIANWIGLSDRVTIEQAQAGRVKPGQYFIGGDGGRFTFAGNDTWLKDFTPERQLNISKIGNGAFGVFAGVWGVVGGIGLTATGPGAPFGAFAISVSIPTIGFGMANIADGLYMNRHNIPGGLFEAIDIGSGGDGTLGQIADMYSGGRPKGKVDVGIFIVGYYQSNVFQTAIANQDSVSSK